MNVSYALVMTFLCPYGNKVSLSISPVKDTITQAEVNTIMNTIVEKNIFSTQYGDIIGKKGATLRETATSEFTMS